MVCCFSVCVWGALFRHRVRRHATFAARSPKTQRTDQHAAGLDVKYAVRYTVCTIAAGDRALGVGWSAVFVCGGVSLGKRYGAMRHSPRDRPKCKEPTNMQRVCMSILAARYGLYS